MSNSAVASDPPSGFPLPVVIMYCMPLGILAGSADDHAPLKVVLGLCAVAFIAFQVLNAMCGTDQFYRDHGHAFSPRTKRLRTAAYVALVTLSLICWFVLIQIAEGG